MRRNRYGVWEGGPDPLAPPYDVRAAVDAVGAEVLSGGSLNDALRNLLRHGPDGRGGLDRDRAGATAMWKRALFLDQNPRAAVFLAEALENGEAIAADKAEAIRLYELAARQGTELEASNVHKRRLLVWGNEPPATGLLHMMC